MARHRGRHSRGASSLADASDGSLVATEAPADASTSGEGASFTQPELALNGTSATVGSAPGGALAAVLEASPDPASVSAPEAELAPVSRLVPVTLSPPLSQPLAEAPTPDEVQLGPHRRRWPWVALVLLVVVVVVGGLQLARPFPAVSLQRALPTTSPVVGATPAMPWPAVGEAAVAVPRLGVTVQSGPEAAVPIASLTKIMTGYLTLRDHPLAPSAQGPLLTMTAADQADASAEEAAGATNVPVQPGEQLTERQLLNGLLVHSANNFADVLATWDAGSVPAFVTKMNAAAASLGMTHTHYADASGLNPGTTGTAGDELLVTQAAMAIPTFAAVVAQPEVSLPIAGVLTNYVSSVGTDGIIGVKSGFTQAAMGCLVLAAHRTVDGHQVLVLAAVTGQPGTDPLSAANQVDEQLLNAAAAGLRQVPVTASGAQVGTVTLPWTRQKVPVIASQAISLLAWPGQEPRLVYTSRPLRPGLDAGAQVGTLSAAIGRERVAVPVSVADSLLGPSVTWRLQRS